MFSLLPWGPIQLDYVFNNWVVTCFYERVVIIFYFEALLTLLQYPHRLFQSEPRPLHASVRSLARLITCD